MIILEHFDPKMLLTSNQRLHWAPKGERTAYWRGLGASLTLRANLQPMERARFVFHLRFPNNVTRDVGNWYPTAKACVDGMVSDAGLLPNDDDAHLIGPDMRRDYPNGPHRIRIEIEELS